jgi:hypothetical protein
VIATVSLQAPYTNLLDLHNRDICQALTSLFHQNCKMTKKRSFHGCRNISIFRVLQYSKILCGLLQGTCVNAVGIGTALQARKLWIQFPLVPLTFFIGIILLAALWP